MEQDNIEKEVFKILLTHNKNMQKTNELRKMNLYCDCMLSSLDIVEFFMELEKKFDIKFTDDEICETKMVEETITLIKNKIKNE